MTFQFDHIDLEAYPRREHFEHFFELQLTYSVTVSIDVTELIASLKARGLRVYPTQIWMLAEIVNRTPEFRMSVDPEGQLGLFDLLHPLFTVFNDRTETFSSLWTAFSADFSQFYDAAVATIVQYNTGAYLPQSDLPINALNVSSLPWLEFSAFNLNMPSDYTLPIFTIGRHSVVNGRTSMPLAIQVHHAVCDGFHLGKFVDNLQRLVDRHDDWLPALKSAGE